MNHEINKQEVKKEELQAKFHSLKNPRDVAALLDIEYKRLAYHIYKVPPASRYEEFHIRKKSGGTRAIHAPVTALKIIQRNLNSILVSIYSPKPSVHGFVSHRSIVTNASAHERKRFVLNIDIKDFFPSINFGRVRGMFMAKPYGLPSSVATVLAQICCHNNQLPQGAPTSPIISNMICQKLDNELFRLAKKHGCTYSRYADDISFSTSVRTFPASIAKVVNDKNGRQVIAGYELVERIRNNGFEINEGKTRLRDKLERQEVTGLTVNKFPNVRRKHVRQVRAMLHAWEKFGLEEAAKEFAQKYDIKHRGPYNKNPKFLRVVRGKIEYIGMVRGKSNAAYVSLLKKYKTLSPGYQEPDNSFSSTISDGLWVLECEEDCIQGTAFALEGTGLVTCQHVLGKSTRAFKANQHDAKYLVEVVAEDANMDLAILKINAPIAKYLDRGNPAVLKLQDKIVLAGFPNYKVGNTPYIADGAVTQFWDDKGIKRFMISANIVAGNSGGPVFDYCGKVVGVAVTGADNFSKARETERHGVIPIDVIDLLTKKNTPS